MPIFVVVSHLRKDTLKGDFLVWLDTPGVVQVFDVYGYLSASSMVILNIFIVFYYYKKVFI